jgi:cystathionine beta-lyase/cystathionine gamma-synthase
MAVNVLSNLGLKFDFVDTRDLDQINDTIHANTKWIFVETPTNPLLELTDINALSNLCNENGIKLAVDNTFMSPYGQNPLSLGADVVLHSATKLIGGHSDVINGVLITNDKTMADKLYFIQKSGGAVPSPFDCWLLLRSTKTLGLRVQRQSDNAMELAKQLESQPMVHTVIYPGLKSHSQYDLAKTQQLNPNGAPIFGSLISIKLGSTKKRDLFLSKVKLFTLAESLGGVESLVCIPYNMTHGAVPSRMKAEMGLTEDLIRLSIGIEHFDDLYSDLTLALQE